MSKKKDKSEKKASAKKDIDPQKKAAKKKNKAAVSPEAEILEQAISISTDDINLRAYFISEKRRSEGREGDSHGDWIEAESQLQAEARRNRKRK